ncbi:hypothetical protein OAU50_04930 [Planctomycetota bacterium]|nr:hypothetical protein [Planctomycetota bacterium]
MKKLFSVCALAIVATALSQFATAEAQGYRAHATTASDLAETADLVVIGSLDRVENVAAEGNTDAAAFKRVGDGSVQDGEDNIRREGVLLVSQVLKGSGFAAGEELRFVSIRQLKKAAYDVDLRTGEAMYFFYTRADGLKAPISNERGTISADEAGGNLSTAIDFVSSYIASGFDKQSIAGALLDQVKLDNSRLSVDACLELSWSFDSYELNETQKQKLSQLLVASESNSPERNQLLTAVGRHAPEGALNTLLSVMFTDSAWSTTSLGAMSLEYINRGQGIVELLSRFDAASNDEERMVAIRALGLIRPKAGYDGVELRTRTLNAIKGLLNAETDKDLLREALIASRDMRSEAAHIAELKALIDGRKTNGLTSPEVHAAIIALSAAQVDTINEEGLTVKTSIELDYLVALGVAEPVLKQIVDSAVQSPFSALIAGADGRGH